MTWSTALLAIADTLSPAAQLCIATDVKPQTSTHMRHEYNQCACQAVGLHCWPTSSGSSCTASSKAAARAEVTCRRCVTSSWCSGGSTDAAQSLPYGAACVREHPILFRSYTRLCPMMTILDQAARLHHQDICRPIVPPHLGHSCQEAHACLRQSESKAARTEGAAPVGTANLQRPRK